MSTLAVSANFSRTRWLTRQKQRTAATTQHRMTDPMTPENRSPSPPRRPNNYNFLYTKEHQANLLNFVDFLSEEILEDKQHVELLPVPEFSLVEPEFIGSGETMEVYKTKWKGKPVAVKRMNRDQKPRRNHTIPLEKDIAYLEERNEFYSKIGSVIQEIRIMCREPLSDHRNIVRLLALSWDEIETNNNTEFFAPLLILELAHKDTPTLESYYRYHKQGESLVDGREILADIADGVAVLHQCSVIHGDLKPENILLFGDTTSKTRLVAKIGDFGFSDANGARRGRTRRWAAPECLDGCPREISESATSIPLAADIYSFGLICLFVLLEGSSLEDALGTNSDGFDQLKFSHTALEKFEKLLYICFDTSNRISTPRIERDCLIDNYTLLLRDTLQTKPSKRVPSLENVRLKLTGR
ncbi:Phytochrome [Dactylellina cionopaga]|nr:Phytochrome [Dactylellina cionopaga]